MIFEIRYGDIHSVSLFGHPVVVLSSLPAINEFRAASPENFSHRWTNILKIIPTGRPTYRVGIKTECGVANSSRIMKHLVFISE